MFRSSKQNDSSCFRILLDDVYIWGRILIPTALHYMENIIPMSRCTTWIIIAEIRLLYQNLNNFLTINADKKFQCNHCFIEISLCFFFVIEELAEIVTLMSTCHAFEENRCQTNRTCPCAIHAYIKLLIHLSCRNRKKYLQWWRRHADDTVKSRSSRTAAANSYCSTRNWYAVISTWMNAAHDCRSLIEVRHNTISSMMTSLVLVSGLQRSNTGLYLILRQDRHIHLRCWCKPVI